VELIAASDADTTAESRTQKISFTQDICSAVMHMRRESGFVDFSQVLARILARKGKTQKPIHQCLEGTIPIALRLAMPVGFSKENAAPVAQLHAPRPSAANPLKKDTSLVLAGHGTGTVPDGEVRVLCTVKFGDDIGAERLEHFLSWVKHLDHSFTIKTECAYQTSSTVMICCVPLHIWLRLNTLGANIIAKLHCAQHSDLAVRHRTRTVACKNERRVLFQGVGCGRAGCV
jgi:hypothetical protein